MILFLYTIIIITGGILLWFASNVTLSWLSYRLSLNAITGTLKANGYTKEHIKEVKRFLTPEYINILQQYDIEQAIEIVLSKFEAEKIKDFNRIQNAFVEELKLTFNLNEDHVKAILDIMTMEYVERLMKKDNNEALKDLSDAIVAKGIDLVSLLKKLPLI